MYRLHFAPLLTHPWAFRLFLSLAFMNKAAMNMGVYVSESVSSSLGVHTKKFCLSFKGKRVRAWWKHGEIKGIFPQRLVLLLSCLCSEVSARLSFWFTARSGWEIPKQLGCRLSWELARRAYIVTISESDKGDGIRGRRKKEERGRYGERAQSVHALSMPLSLHLSPRGHQTGKFSEPLPFVFFMEASWQNHNWWNQWPFTN